MNLDYFLQIQKTTHRPANVCSHEDAHCDNEVNLILEKKHTQSIAKQTPESSTTKEKSSAVSNQQPRPYYFMPIREQISTTALAGPHVTDSTLSPSLDLPHPSKVNLFDESLSLSNYFESRSPTMNNPPLTASVDEWDQKSLGLNVDDFALLCSSLMTTTSSQSQETMTTSIDQFNHDHQETTPHNEVMSNNSGDAVFNGINDLGFISPKALINGEETIEPPPGFENFHLNSSLSNDLLLSQTTNNSLINTTTSNRIAETPVSSSDKLNFSQLFASINTEEIQEQQQASKSARIGPARSSSSSHSSFTSDEQSIFFPMLTHPYSLSNSTLHANSQIFINTTPPPISTTAATNSVAKLNIPPNSLSSSFHHPGQPSSSSSSSLSRMTSSATDSPLPKVSYEPDKKVAEGESSSNHLFSSANSFFTNGHTDLTKSKRKISSLNHQSSVPARTSTSSGSSSTSSSNDELLIHFNRKPNQKRAPINQTFPDEQSSLLNYSSLLLTSTVDEEQEQAIHDNINFLASMTTTSIAETPEMIWPSNPVLNSNSLEHANTIQRTRFDGMAKNSFSQKEKISSYMIQSHTLNIQEMLGTINELCYKGFDELHGLIQAKRNLENSMNVNPVALDCQRSPVLSLNGSNSASSRILIVAEYFIFKCKKVESTTSQLLEILVFARPQLKIRDHFHVIKAWKETIENAELIHQEQENKLRLSIEHPNSYYMTDAVLQSVFDRVYLAIQLLVNATQQVHEMFRLITSSVYRSLGAHQSVSQSSTAVQSSLSSSTNQNSKVAFFYRASPGSLS